MRRFSTSDKHRVTAAAHVLIVSPFAADRTILRSAAEQAGSRPFEARTYADAVTALCLDRFSAIVCDWELPDGTWQDVVAHVACSADPPRVLIACPAANAAKWMDVADFGGYGFLEKPFDLMEVRDGIAAACEDTDREGCWFRYTRRL